MFVFNATKMNNPKALINLWITHLNLMLNNKITSILGKGVIERDHQTQGKKYM